MQTSEEIEESTDPYQNPEMEGATVHNIEVYKISAPTIKFLSIFPARLERSLEWFDNPIIKLCQTPRGNFFFLLSHFFTALVAIEYIVALPILLFILGFDHMGSKCLYIGMVLCFFSQVPKRFVWRYRPYMAYRAEERQRDKTSSFPSRAVACSVVYAYVVNIFVMFYTESKEISWWMFLLMVVCPILASFSRINLGVHYPSDCLCGAILGLTVCTVANGFYQLDKNICGECYDPPDYSLGVCYAGGPIKELSS
eukprot:TRINITY_DN7569_c0_g1_i2.p1 TRINITY_DN7569_c0_g1~~TRINITY_DN7569_c0_g1_i2.p1  ORF type:complete len:284 (+),score=30.53 TRINITY_DN7569_c0_g1_i2:91-852(+)